MTTAPQTTEQRRAAYISGLRALADLLEERPELKLPYSGSKSGAMLVIPHSGDEQREQLTAWARALPGRREKKERDGYLDLVGSIHGLYLEVICARDEVCEKVVTGTREVTEEVPDPEALAAVPTVTVTKTVEDVKWICKPLLADDTAEAELAVA